MKKILILGIGALLVAQLSAPASAQTITPIELGTGQGGESLAVDLDNNCYLSHAATGTILKVTPGGAVSIFATIPGPPNKPGGARIFGLKFDCAGNLCVCGLSSDPNDRGVYKVSPDGTVSAFSVNQGFTAPNDICFDPQGNLYLSEGVAAAPVPGKIWKIDPAGNATLWTADALLTGSTIYGFPGTSLGPNGIAFGQDNTVLYVLNTSAGEVVEVPVNPDGSAGTASVLVQSPELSGADGLALDIYGNIYVAANIQNQIVKVTPSGAVSILADASSPGGSLFSIPTSLAFGRGREQTTMFICNSSEFPAPTYPSNPNLSGLLELDLGIPGVPADCSFEDTDFAGANLSGKNLKGADLPGGNFRGANLGGDNLKDADFLGADLSAANLSGANLKDANLQNANLSGADLSGANLQGADLSGAELAGADLYGANLQGANLQDADFTDADLSGANLQNADTTGAIFTGAITTGCHDCP